MHFEVLVEDLSGKIALESILEKIVGPNGAGHSYRIFSYKGIGHIPKNLNANIDPRNRMLLNQLPRLLRGYGKSLKQGAASVVVVVDLDRKDCQSFKQELMDVLSACNPKPTALFGIAIEEGEAWLLGDREAIKGAYPKARDNVLDRYVQDSICDTWEKLADAIYQGGSPKLAPLGYPDVGRVKCEWAERIAPYMDVDKNKSKSFQVFRDGVRRLAGIDVRP